MALVKKNNTKPSDMEKADAFLNLKIVDANGVEHNLGKGLPLYERNRLMRSLINAVKANPDATFNLTATIHIVAEENAEDIPFA